MQHLAREIDALGARRALVLCTPEQRGQAEFSVNWTAFAIFMVVIGGIGRIEGPLEGALIFWALNKFFSDHGTWYLLGLGLLAIVVTLLFKQGLWGYAQQRWGWSLFLTQRRLVQHPS